MRSEALDITIESRGNAVWLSLAGRFNNEQVPNIKEKIEGLIGDGNRQLVIDMERVTDVGEAVPTMFLEQLSSIRGRGGELRLVFRNPTVSHAFRAYRNIFQIHPNAQSLARGGLLGTLRHQQRVLSRKTGVRLSRPVALFLLFVLCGWFLSLAFIIHLQNRRLQEQEAEIQLLTQWKREAGIEISELRERLLPMEQLGILRDSLPDR